MCKSVLSSVGSEKSQWLKTHGDRKPVPQGGGSSGKSSGIDLSHLHLIDVKFASG